MSKRIKILFVLPILSSVGGVQTVVSQIIRNLPLKDYDIHIFGVKTDELSIQKFEDLGIKVHCMKINSILRKINFLPIIYLNNLIHNYEFDIVHAHNARAAFWLLGCRFSCKTKFMYTPHTWRFNQLTFSPLKNAIKYLEKRICKRADLISLITPQYEHSIAQIHNIYSSSKVCTIPNRINGHEYENILDNHEFTLLRNELNIPDGAFVIGNIGRLSHEKSPDKFLHLASLLASVQKNFFFVWIGGGKLEKYIYNLSIRLGLEGRFIVTGHQEHARVKKLIKILDVLVLTSKYEGLPIVILEAMASQVNVVAYSVGGVPDVIQNGIDGFLVQPDDYQEVVRSVIQIYSNPIIRNTLKNAAFKKVTTDYSPCEIMAKQYALAYQELMSETIQSIKI